MLKISAVNFVEMIRATEGYEMIEIASTRKGMVLTADPHGTEVRELSFHDGVCWHSQREDDQEYTHGQIDFAEGLRWLCGHGN